MKVMLVRASKPECEPTCPEWISAEGRIVDSSASAFMKVLNKLGGRKLPVLIHSPGGDVKQAQLIALAIRKAGLDVLVARTRPNACRPSDKSCGKRGAGERVTGEISGDTAICTSACPIILAGGVRRFVGPRAKIGVHQIRSFQTRIQITRTYQIETRETWGEPTEQRRTLISERRTSTKPVKVATRDSAYRDLANVFNRLGIASTPLIDLYMNTPEDKIRLLTRIELVSIKLATHLVSPDLVLAGHIPSAPGEPLRSATDPRDNSPLPPAAEPAEIARSPKSGP